MNDTENLALKTLEKVMKPNDYLKKLKPTLKKDETSLCYIIDKALSQSQKIKLGYAVELITKEYIKYANPKLIDIKGKVIKGEKEMDHLFVHDKIIYAEIKCNLNLDTEKCKSTYDKILYNHGNLEIKFPEYKVSSYLVSPRYLNKEKIPKEILKKYNSVEVIGLDDYFKLLGVPDDKLLHTKELHKDFINLIANEVFKRT